MRSWRSVKQHICIKIHKHIEKNSSTRSAMYINTYKLGKNAERVKEELAFFRERVA